MFSLSQPMTRHSQHRRNVNTGKRLDNSQPLASSTAFFDTVTGHQEEHPHTHTRTRTPGLTALFPGLPRWAGTRKVKPIWILLKQETVSGSGISWDICKSAPHPRQITTPAPHRSVFYRLDALPAAQPTASKHWRQNEEHPTDKNWGTRC